MRIINNWIAKRLNKCIFLIFEKINCRCIIQNIRIKKINFSIFLDKTLLSKKGNLEEFVSIRYIHGRLSLWESLFKMELMGEISLKDVNINTKVLSDKPLFLESLMMTFRIKRKLKIVCINIGNISCFLQLESIINSKELIIDISDFTWNDVYDLLSTNFTSDILQNIYSNDKLHMQVYLKKFKNVDKPFLHANISYDHLTFNNRKKGKLNIVNRDYLISLLNKKLNNKPESYIYYRNIPKDMINAIICTEDPLFWSHKGIALDFIGLALASNLKEQRIVRGASTISMQLTRNLFLSQSRTLFRKTEESILTLLLENYYKIDKQTILELYINIIELAPGINGLYDASFFYFGKKYIHLTLIEIITLTYIIPRPKHFYEALIIQSSQLETNIYNHIKVYSHSLLYKGLITIGRYQEIGTKVRFTEKFGTLDFYHLKKAETQYALNQSLSNLEDIHPNFVEVIKEAIISISIPFIITEGVRTTERQKELYAQGRTSQGKIITNCDGVKDKSNHQLKKDGYGYAIDLYPYICDNIRIHETYVPDCLQIIAEHIKIIAQKMNRSIAWGGDWNMKDYPHFEFKLSSSPKPDNDKVSLR